jgi:polysaccharide export outer membrane protein
MVTTSIYSAKKPRTYGHDVRLTGLAILFVAFGFQHSNGADSTVRFVESRDKNQASAPELAGAKRESLVTVRVASVTSTVLGRQESKLVKRPTAETNAQVEEFAKAIREAIALRDAINVPVPKEAVVRENRGLSNKSSSRTNTMTFAAAAKTPAPAENWTTPAVNAPAPTEVTHIPVPSPPARVAKSPTPRENWTAPAPKAFSTAPTVSTPVQNVPALNAAFHPHVETEPAVTPNLAAAGPAVTQEQFILSDPLGCAYGPGQSGAQIICGVDCGLNGGPCCATWEDAHCIPWSLFGPGEYVGPSRTEHVSSYYLRVNDLLTLTYITSRQVMGERYRLGVGDRLRVESSVDETLDREVYVQPDGEITLPLVGEVMAAGKTVKELREELIEVFRGTQRQPQITITPLEINSGLQEIIKAVKSEIGSTGQAQDLKVTPEGTIQVPGLGSVYVQGLTLEELRAELEARYKASFGAGLMISPALTQRATSYVFVGGEVKSPNRYTLEGPTTVMQAVAMAGGWNIGGNVRQIVVFRRDENWCLKAIKIDVRAPLYGADPCPVNDVWLRDNDLVIIPKTKVLCATDVINLYFTRGVYAVFPVTFFQDLSRGSTVIP